MAFDISEYMRVKRALRFRSDGAFRILLLCDPHGGTNLHPQLIPGVNAIIKAAKPDLVLFGGDLTGNRVGCDTISELETYMRALTREAESAGIPWAHVFGNHDYNRGISNAEQQALFESFPHCVSKYGPKDIHGVGNYVLPVISSNGDDVAFNIWALDTHDDNRAFLQAYDLPEDTRIALPEHFGMGYHSDSVHTDQVLWYFETSRAIERAFKRNIPGIMYMHIPLIEFCLIPRNPEQTRMTGEMRERVCANELNPGLFSACLQRGDIRGIYCGHDHLNDFSGMYCGINLANCAGINYDAGSADDLRGGRVIEIHENDPRTINTYMLKLRDVLGGAADNRFAR